MSERNRVLDRGAKLGHSPLVSILVPSYNSQAYLTECLESALSQTYPWVETIVVDDGSTDGSLELARSFEVRGVRVIAQDNLGQAGALNTAFAAASGDYLQYLDADDVLHSKKIEIQIARLLDAQPLAMASGAWARFYSSISEAVFEPEPVWEDLAPADWLVRSWRGGGMMHVAGWLIPRNVVEAAGPWVESLRWAANLDAHFFSRALLASSICHFCRDARSYYRSGLASMSQWKSRPSLEASFQVVVDTGEALLKMEDTARTRAAFADNLQRFVYSTYPDGPDLIAQAEERIVQLGGSSLPLSAGPMTKAAARYLGWKTAKRLRRLSRGWNWN